MNLEKEIEKYYYDNFAFVSSVHIPTLDILTAIAKHFVEWQKEQDHDACRTCEKSRDAVFYKGMEYAKEQMVTEKDNMLTWEDVADIVILADTILDGNEEEWHKRGPQDYYEEVLKAFFNDKKNERR